MCTSPRTVAIIAYLDWDSNPTIEKNIFDKSISIRWYKTIESTESTMNMLGPQTKFSEKRSCEVKSNDKNIGAITVEGRGIKKISFVNILNKSARIWNAPFLPIRVGPIRRWAKARSFRSNNTTNKVNNTTSSEESKAISWINSNKLHINRVYRTNTYNEISTVNAVK